MEAAMTAHVHDTWYLLVDGTYADPNEVSHDKDGVLKHKNGVAVALRESGVPHTIGVDAVQNKNVEAAKAGRDAEHHAKPKGKQMKADDEPKHYKTREMKGD